MTVVMMERLPQEDVADRKRRAGQWLREQRDARGFSARKLARAMGIDSAVISNYERGISAISDERAEQIAEALQLPVLHVRKHVGLWVPEEYDEHAEVPWREYIKKYPKAQQEALRHIFEVFDSLPEAATRSAEGMAEHIRQHEEGGDPEKRRGRR